MQDQNFGYGSASPDERLHTIRQPQAAPVPTASTKNWRNEILLGAVVLGLVLCVGVLFSRGPSASTPQIDVDTNPAATVPASTVEGLLDGEALIGVNLEVGNFPMEMGEGDVVRVIVTPAMSDTTEARELVPTVRVRSIEAIGEFSGRYAATLLGAREVATAIATSGPIHLAIVKKGSAQ